MGGRYYVTGVQIGLIEGAIEVIKEGKNVVPTNELYDDILRLLNDIQDNQYIGEMPFGEPNKAFLVVNK